MRSGILGTTGRGTLEVLLGLGWALFLAGLPFAVFFDTKLDIRHAAGVWAHGWLILLAVPALFGRQIRLATNWPLAAFCAWAAMTHWARWRTSLPFGTYPAWTLMPLLHILALALFYHAATTQWTKARMVLILNSFCWASLAVTVYAAIQLAGLDQFFKHLGDSRTMVSTIGNPSHLAAYWALTLPVLLWQQTRGWHLLAIIQLIGLVLIGSIGGLAAAGLVLLIWFWRWRWAIIPVGMGMAALLTWHNPSFISDSGRLEAWRYFWELFIAQGKPVTGAGIGWIYQYAAGAATGPMAAWRHVHCEPYQVLIELGLVGVGLLAWAIIHWGQVAVALTKTRLTRTLICMAAAFGVLSLVTYSAHLWVLAVFGLFAYCGVYALENQNGLEHIKRAP